MGDVTLWQVIAGVGALLGVLGGGGILGILTKVSKKAEESAVRETKQENAIDILQEKVKELEQFEKEQSAYNNNFTGSLIQINGKLENIHNDTHSTKDEVSKIDYKLDELLLKLSTNNYSN